MPESSAANSNLWIGFAFMTYFARLGIVHAFHLAYIVVVFIVLPLVGILLFRG